MTKLAKGLRIYESYTEALYSLMESTLTPHQDALVRRAFRRGIYLGVNLKEGYNDLPDDDDPREEPESGYGEIDKGDEEDSNKGLDDKTSIGLDNTDAKMPKPVKPGEEQVDEAIAHGRIGNTGYLPPGSEAPPMDQQDVMADAACQQCNCDPCECQPCPVCQSAPCQCEGCPVCGMEECECNMGMDQEIPRGRYMQRSDFKT